MSHLLLRVQNLHVQIDQKQILKGLSLDIKPGEVHAIMGPNGSGKSTLAYTLAGHPRYTVTQGKVELDGKDLLALSPDQRASKGFFLAFQYPVEVSGVPVQHFLRVAVETRFGKLQSILEFRKQLQIKAKKLGIKEELLTRSLNEGFSGGEKKRVEILQMAVLQPRLAVLDETDSGLDVDAMKTVAAGVKAIVKEHNTGVIVITHYQRLLKYLRPDFVHVMVDGKIAKSGDTSFAAELEKKGYAQYLQKEPVSLKTKKSK